MGVSFIIGTNGTIRRLKQSGNTMSDSKGYEKGARGIDGKKGEDFVSSQRNKTAEKAMYGRSWPMAGEGGKVDITGGHK
jgi:hypothetical protein